MTVLHQIPSALAVVGVAVTGTVAATARLPLDAQAIEIALIGGGAIVVAQIVIAIAAARQARLAREAASEAAQQAKVSGIKLDRIGVNVDGRLTAATREIASLRGELSRIYPANLKVQQQAEDAKTDADAQAESSRRAKLDATGSLPAVGKRED